MVWAASLAPEVFAAASRPRPTGLKPWCFTFEEVEQIDRIRHSHLTSQRAWKLTDVPQTNRIDTVMIRAGEKYICISKRIAKETLRPAYDIAIEGEAGRTELSLAAAGFKMARYLQVSNRLDLVFEKIEAQIDRESPALK